MDDKYYRDLIDKANLSKKRAVVSKLTLFLQVTFIVILMCSGFGACQKNNKLIINIQPIDNNIDNIEETIDKFDDYLKNIGLRNYEIRLCSISHAPNGAYINYSYEDMDWWRFRADSLIKYLDNKNRNEFTIGVTKSDISCTIHGVKDFGVLGLSFLGHKHNACVVSTFRLKNEKDLWKLMAHEFTHGYFSKGHCKADDPHCIMQDAKKKPNFAIKDSLCNICREEIELNF